MQVLRDLELTFFKAMLVPAAHVYLHVDEGKGRDLSERLRQHHHGISVKPVCPTVGVVAQA